MAKSQRGGLTPKVIKVKISDSVGVSDSPDRRDRSSGGSKGRSSDESESSRRAAEQAARAAEARSKQQAQARLASQQKRTARQFAAQQRREEKLAKRGQRPERVSTGVFTKGGATVRETRGDFVSLQRLNKQRPGSVLVQRADGTFILVEATGGINLAKPSTFKRFQENLALEGRQLFFPTSEAKEGGGTKFIRKIQDTIGTSEGISGFTEKPGGTAFSINLVEGGSKQKTRPAHPREIAAAITKGQLLPQFIGDPSIAVATQQSIARAQSQIQVQLPQTFVDDQGREIATIKGQSKGAQFSIFQSDKDFNVPQGKTDPLHIPVDRSVLDVGIKQPDKKPNIIIDVPRDTFKAIGADIASDALKFGVPQETKPIKAKLAEQRPSVPIDALTKKGATQQDFINLVQTPEGILSLGALAVTAIIPGKRLPNLKFGLQKQEGKVREVADIIKEPKKITGVERIGESTFLISKGTVDKPAKIPLTLVEFGKKGRPTVTEIPAEKVRGINVAIEKVKEINIQGSLFPKFQKSLSAKKIGKFEFKTDKVNEKSRFTLAEGLRGEGIKPIALGRTTKLENIRLGKTKQLRQDLTRKVLFAQTRAETSKFRPPKNPLVPPDPATFKQGRPFEASGLSRVGAGQSGKGSALSTKEIDTVKSLIIASVQKPQLKQDFLGSINPPVFLQGQASEELAVQFPPGTSTRVTATPKISSTQSKSLIKQITPAKSQTSLNAITGERTRLQSPQKLGIVQEQRSKAGLRPGLTARQATSLITPQRSKTVLKLDQPLIPDKPLIPKKLIVPRPIGLFVPRDRPRRRPKVVREKRPRVDFLGSTNIETVEGFRTKKGDIVFGKKARRLARKNVKKTRAISSGVKIF